MCETNESETNENVSQDSVKHVSQVSVKHSNVNKDVKNPPRSPKSGALLKPFNSVTAKAAQEASARARSLRKQMRAQLLDAAINDAKIGDIFVKAIKTKDADLMKLVETGLKIVGLTHDQSEDAVTKMEVKSDAKVDSKLEVSITGV